jgi:hypothetical protein
MIETPQEYRILISKKSAHKKFLPEINRILEKLTADETLLAIRNKYLE